MPVGKSLSLLIDGNHTIETTKRMSQTPDRSIETLLRVKVLQKSWLHGYHTRPPNKRHSASDSELFGTHAVKLHIAGL